MENSIIQNFDFSSAGAHIFRAFKKTKYRRKDLYISARQITFSNLSGPTRYELRIWFGHILDDNCCIRFRHFVPSAMGFGGQGLSSFNFVLRDINYNGDIFAQMTAVTHPPPGHPPPGHPPPGHPPPGHPPPGHPPPGHPPPIYIVFLSQVLIK